MAEPMAREIMSRQLLRVRCATMARNLWYETKARTTATKKKRRTFSAILFSFHIIYGRCLVRLLRFIFHETIVSPSHRTDTMRAANRQCEDRIVD